MVHHDIMVISPSNNDGLVGDILGYFCNGNLVYNGNLVGHLQKQPKQCVLYGQ